MPQDLPECPYCHHELNEVHISRSVKLELSTGAGLEDQWICSDVYSEGISCPNCNEDIERDLFENSVPLPDAI